MGNPSSRYEKTRHNAGFWFLDEIASRHHLSFQADSRIHGALAKLDFAQGAVFLLKPMTYMNRSGGSVAAVAHYYKITPGEILVAHDELDFEPGTVKLKAGGGHGGHNGLRDIIEKLGSSEFYRLRIGIGHPGNRADVTAYVLDRPSAAEGDILRAAISRAVDCFPDLLQGKLEAVMNVLHV